MEGQYLYTLDAIKDNHDFYSSWIKKVFCRIEGGNGVHCSNHCHRDIEIWYTFSSSGTVEINGHVIEARVGDIFVINSGDVHAEKIMLDDQHNMLIVLIRKEFLLSEIPNFDDTIFSVSQEDAQVLLRPILEDMRAALLLKQSDAFYELKEKGYVYQILYTLMSKFSVNRYASPAANVATAHPWLLPVVEYTRKNFTTLTSESELCKRFAVSKEHFSRTFKQRMGITYNDFVTSIRLSCAFKQLMQSDNKISDIADQVGFADVRTFIKVFKKHYGMTPLQYRKAAAKRD